MAKIRNLVSITIILILLGFTATVSAQEAPGDELDKCLVVDFDYIEAGTALKNVGPLNFLAIEGRVANEYQWEIDNEDWVLPMVFNSQLPSSQQWEIATPNFMFGGMGQGAGGEIGDTENVFHQYATLIFADVLPLHPPVSLNPTARAGGATVFATFPASTIAYVSAVNLGAGDWIEFRLEGSVVDTRVVASDAVNGYRTFLYTGNPVDEIVVSSDGVFTVTEYGFCEAEPSSIGLASFTADGDTSRSQLEVGVLVMAGIVLVLIAVLVVALARKED